VDTRRRFFAALGAGFRAFWFGSSAHVYDGSTAGGGPDRFLRAVVTVESPIISVATRRGSACGVCGPLD